MSNSYLGMPTWGAVLLSALVAICGGAASPVQADGHDGEVAAALTEQDMKRGRILFLQCRACHALTPGDNGGKIGPSLAGVFGRSAASAPHYDAYSSALKGAGHVWDGATMNQWLAGPATMVPGTSMVFAGVRDEGQRELLVRYLQEVTRVDVD